MNHLETTRAIRYPAIRWLYLAIGFIAMLFAGVIYAWSILKVPLAGELGWTASQLSLNFTITIIGYCAGNLGAGFLAKKISYRHLLFGAGVLTFVGFFLASKVRTSSLWLLYVAYGGVTGIGIGAAYNVVLSNVSRWFPDKTGLCTGVLMMGFGFSALLLGKLAGDMMAAAVSWRTIYVCIGAAVCIVLFAAALILRTADTALSTTDQTGETHTPKEELSPREMVRQGSFWQFCAFSVLLFPVGSTMISCARDVAMEVGAGEGAATLLVGALSICNGAGRILSGLLFDRIGRKPTMLLESAISVAAPLIVIAAIRASSMPLCVLGVCLCGISYGFSPTVGSAFIMAFYGRKYFSSNCGIVSLTMIPASFAATLCGAIVTYTGSYTLPFCLLVLLAVGALLIDISIRDPK